MSEWWTYSLADLQMYSASTYQRLVELYVAGLTPAQVLGLAFGLYLAWVAWLGDGRQRRIGLGALGVCWLWIAWAWFWQRLATIDIAAPYFAHAFALQGALLLGMAGGLRDDLKPAPPLQRSLASLLVDVAVVAPVVLAVFGIAYGAAVGWEALDWGVAGAFPFTPDATALATLGFVAGLGRARWLLAIPLLWCLVSGAMLWNIAHPYALGVPLLAGLALMVALMDRQRS
jgi:hypothetical protein